MSKIKVNAKGEIEVNKLPQKDYSSRQEQHGRPKDPRFGYFNTPRLIVNGAEVKPGELVKAGK